jgi:hypothetical protein
VWDHDVHLAHQGTHFTVSQFTIRCEDAGAAATALALVQGQLERYSEQRHVQDPLARRLAHAGQGDGLSLRPEEREHYSVRDRQPSSSRAVIAAGLVLAASALLRLRFK